MIVIAGMYYYAFTTTTLTYYQVLQVDRDAQHIDIYQNYKKLSAESDERREKEAYDRAYDVLGKARKRSEYNLYGDIMAM
ncbi:hypothetical protein Pmar_PMAR026135, partial [Perkinsus marinus ATCC 50983]